MAVKRERATHDINLHHPYITHGASACNRMQVRVEDSAHLRRICKIAQSSETPRISLLMSRGKRFESARRLSLFSHDLQGNFKRRVRVQCPSAPLLMPT
jgi:hypothetical protein